MCLLVTLIKMPLNVANQKSLKTSEHQDVPVQSWWSCTELSQHLPGTGGDGWGCGHEVRKRKRRLSLTEPAQELDCLRIITEERRIRLASLGSRGSGEKQPLCCTAWPHQLYAVGLWVTNEQRKEVHRSPVYLFVVGGSLGSTLLLFIICDVYSIVAQLVTDQN